nr:MAG TPA: hypothetical protein [Siphoviridae sp. ctD5s5]
MFYSVVIVFVLHLRVGEFFIDKYILKALLAFNHVLCNFYCRGFFVD